jgi:hypothetical protein
MKTYNINQIRNFLKTQDSFGDIFHHLSEKSIDEANIPSKIENTEENRERLALKAYDHMDESSIRGEMVDRFERIYEKDDDHFQDDWNTFITDAEEE